jgi:hypothetical protein
LEERVFQFLEWLYSTAIYICNLRAPS